MFTPTSFHLIESRSISFQSPICVDSLKLWLLSFGKSQFTGQLTFKVSTQQWRLYFYQGYLIAGASSVHPIRRWYRQIAHHCPQLVRCLSNSSLDYPQNWDYSAFETLLQKETLLPKRSILWQQIADVVEGNIQEILFDIYWMSEQVGQCCLGELQITCGELHPLDGNPNSQDTVLVPVDPKSVLEQTDETWESWVQAGLAQYSPNWVPVVKNAEELRYQVSPSTYQNYVTLMDGNHTLWDLAVCLKQSIVWVARSLLPHLHKTIEIAEVEDLTIETALAKSILGKKLLQLQPSDYLIIYVEDSSLDRFTMSRILAQAGYRFINIQDPVQALPVLVEQKPSLIFLDLVMPVTNGYEICSHIRRIASLKDTPVIIVTSSDGLLDRARAKLVGASDFITKPIDSEKILTVLQRHLSGSTSRALNSARANTHSISSAHC